MWDYSQHLNDTLSSNIHPKYTQQRQCIQLNPDLSVLPHSVCYMFLSPPRPSVTKPSGSQLLRFGTLLNKISGYYHPLALSNAVSKLTSFPTPASHVPHLAIRQRLWLELAWICALYKFCDNNTNNKKQQFLTTENQVLHSVRPEHSPMMEKQTNVIIQSDAFIVCRLTDGMLATVDDEAALFSNEMTSATTNETSVIWAQITWDQQHWNYITVITGSFHLSSMKFTRLGLRVTNWCLVYTKVTFNFFTYFYLFEPGSYAYKTQYNI